MQLKSKNYLESLLRRESQKLNGLAHLIQNNQIEAEYFNTDDANYGIALILKDISNQVRKASIYLEKDLPFDERESW